MAIPTNETIERELLALLARKPNGRFLASSCYDALGDLFPRLTYEERNLKFKNSTSKWANRVQFCRLHLVRQGFIYKAGVGPNPEHGVWIITPTGKEFQSMGM